jgi:predicted AlkP superfamily phosphohydrolase/phosphomutase
MSPSSKTWTSALQSLLVVLATFGAVSCAAPEKRPVEAIATSAELLYAPEARNSAQLAEAPYVVLVSIDGFRHDYATKFQAPHLTRIGETGVIADSLVPVYPSKTFPNHYSIVTGLYANHHGIVSNEFYDPTRDSVYSLPNRQAVEDGSWYAGEPLWTAIEKQGGVTASYFWVGSEADIGGAHPNYYYRYNEQTPNEMRVARVLEWLQLPPERRPHFIAMYFSDVDSAGHRYGPDANETRDAVLKIDAEIGKLQDGLAALKLPINLIIVSDHGMQKLDPQKTIILDETPELAAKLAKFRALGRGPQMLLYLNKGENRKLIAETKSLLDRLAKKKGGVFRARSTPGELKALHYDGTARVGDIVIEPTPPWSVGFKSQPAYTTGGNHGWDPSKTKDMHGIFYAIGPAFKGSTRLPSFENVNVYPLVLEILGLKTLQNIDGRLAPTRPALR